MSGYIRLRDATTVGPLRPIRAARRLPTITTAAAPSPNSPLATMLGIDTSSRWTVSEHSSTDSSTATSSGWPSEVVVQPGDPGGTRDAAEPEHRHALDVRAQAEAGHQPCLEGRCRDARDRRRHHEVDSAGSIPAVSSAPVMASCGEVEAHPDEGVVGGAEVVEVRVVLEGEGQVPALARRWPRWIRSMTSWWAPSGETTAEKAAVMSSCG